MMMEMRLSAEQEALKDLVREFVRRSVAPVALERDKCRDDRERFPWDLVEQGSELGLRTLTVPAAYGGADADLLTTCTLGEELSAGDLGVAVIFHQEWKIARLLGRIMSPAQQAEFFPRFVDEPRHLLAAGFTEPDQGSDRWTIPNDPRSTLRTTAVRRDDGWVLNGTKHFISNGSVASTYVIHTNTNPGQPMSRSLTAFLVPAGTPGFSIGRIHHKLGQRLVMNAELVFEDCWVPDSQRLSAVNGSFGGRERFMTESQVEAAAVALGVARSAFETALDWARTRVQGGRRIIGHQAVAMMLADMATRIEATRSLIWRAACAVEADDPAAPRLGGMVKVMATESAVDVARWAVEIHGGYGIMEEMAVEKHLRDAMTLLHSDGTSQVHRLRVAAWLDGSRPGEWPEPV